MAICRECGVEVAENDEICMSCGFPQVPAAPRDVPEIETAEKILAIGAEGRSIDLKQH